MTNPNYYAVLPADVRYNTKLKANEKLLYCEITALCNKNGYCYATNSYFAALYEVHKNTIGSWINNLVKQGYLKTEIIYKKPTKQIVQRRIYIASKPINKEVDTYQSKDDEPTNENIDTPINQIIEENITREEYYKKNKEKIYKKESFEIFYKAYPRKTQKQNALRAFEKIHNSLPPIDELIAILEKHKRTRQWQDKQYIPHPATWLNQKRWEDELNEEDFKEPPKKGIKLPSEYMRELKAKQGEVIETEILDE